MIAARARRRQAYAAASCAHHAAARVPAGRAARRPFQFSKGIGLLPVALSIVEAGDADRHYNQNPQSSLRNRYCLTPWVYASPAPQLHTTPPEWQRMAGFAMLLLLRPKVLSVWRSWQSPLSRFEI